jgi:SPP1 gp7 family putative phage head morphogenesis protein
MAKPKVNKSIREGSVALTQIMREQLPIIAEGFISQVMAKAKKLTPSQRLKAISGLEVRGGQEYKNLIKTGLAILAFDALQQARKEVPSKKNLRLSDMEDSIQLGEFERLPPKLQKKITSQTQLLVGKQIGDLQKVIEFAYATAEEETDSLEQIRQDLDDSAIGWIDGTAVESGAALNAATIINSARNAFFFDDSVLEEVEAFEFVNGDPVTDICQDLAGTIFSKDDPAADRYFPPLHWNCKSYIVPILTGNLNGRDIEKLAPSKKSLEDEIQFSEHFESGCCANHITIDMRGK